MEDQHLPLNTEEFAKLHDMVELYVRAKELVLIGETLDPDQRTQIQPLNEFRNALDHLMRALSSKMGLRSEDNVGEGYALVSLDRAFGHVYRAGYDALDWLAIISLERIKNDLSDHSPQAIQAAIPSYFGTIKPRIEKLNGEIIPHLRTVKDIGSPNKVNFDDYAKVTEELSTYAKLVSDKKPGLVEYDSINGRHVKKAEQRGMRNGIIGGIIATIIILAIGWGTGLVDKLQPVAQFLGRSTTK